MGGNAFLAVRWVDVAAPFVGGHRRVERLAVEVGDRHPMIRFQPLDDGADQRVVVAVFERMAVDDLESHAASLACVAGGR